jgi:DNA-binding transcriptional regulator YiaG
MKNMLPKSPRKEHWEALNSLQKDTLLTPQEFLSHWQLTYKEVALITGCSLDQVKKWLTSRTKPPVEAMRRLSLVHDLWTKIGQS